MFEAAGGAAIAVGDNDMLNALAFTLHFFKGAVISCCVGIAHVAQRFIVKPFDEAAAIQQLSIFKPHHNIVGGVALAGVVGFKAVLPDCKYRIAGHEVRGKRFVVFSAPAIRLHGGVGSNAFAVEVMEAGGFIAVPMRGNTHHHRLLMPGHDTVQQGLALGTVPRRIEQHHTFIGNHIHAIGRNVCAFIEIVSRISVKIAGDGGDAERGLLSRNLCTALS